MKTLFAATLIGLTALTATAATSRLQPAEIEVDETLVNARIDARQNELMRALLAGRQASHTAHASR